MPKDCKNCRFSIYNFKNKDYDCKFEYSTLAGYNIVCNDYEYMFSKVRDD